MSNTDSEEHIRLVASLLDQRPSGSEQSEVASFDDPLYLLFSQAYRAVAQEKA